MTEESTELCAVCGLDEGLDKQTCDRCGRLFCDDCGPYREDDAPFDLCEECWEKPYQHKPQIDATPTLMILSKENQRKLE